MIHLTTQQLSSSLDRELGEASEANVQEHLAACPDCASRLEKLEALEEKLIQALRSDPEEYVFERIARDVDRRTRPAPRASAQPSTASASPSRETGPAPDATRGSSSFPWGWVILVLAAASGIGALNFAAEYVPRWLGVVTANQPAAATAAAGPAAGGDAAPAPDAPVGAAFLNEPPAVLPDESQPADSGPADGEGTPAPAPAPRQLAAPPRPASQPAPQRGDQVRIVEERPSAPADAPVREAIASARPSPLEFDAMGDSLEQVLGSLHGNEYRDARQQLGDARYRAWRLEPLDWRASRAAAALRAYMVVALPGMGRETAIRRLEELEESGVK